LENSTERAPPGADAHELFVAGRAGGVLDDVARVHRVEEASGNGATRPS
jgi:hypothetical protein